MFNQVYFSITVALLMVMLSVTAFSQSVEDFIKQGIELHDNGEYDKAIQIYQQALEINPKSSLAHYEIALTYQTLEDYQNALKHSKHSLELDGNNRAAYVIMGSALDDLGRPGEAVEAFEKCLKKFGGHYLVHYNLALTHFRLKQYEAAEKNLLKGISLNPSHASSHLLMANLKKDTGNKTQSVLGYYYFLLIEPNTERSKEAYTNLQAEMKANVTVDKNDPNHITVTLDPKGGSTQMMIALMQAAKNVEEVKERNKDKTQGELFVEDSQMLFGLTGGEKVKKKDRNLWNRMYAPLFSNIAKTDHIHAFCYYISQSSSEESVLWLKNNKGRLDQFGLWLDKNN
jgi:Tfp pilus assembly protein PilF